MLDEGAKPSLEHDILYTNTSPRPAPCETFWREIVPGEHSVQIYTDPVLFLDALEGYASSGFRMGESVIVIATAAHRHALERRLGTRGYDVDLARAENCYLSVDAETALAQFMVNGWPDADRFQKVIAGLINQARGNGRQVRAFGEMVAILWNQDQHSAAIRLEELWNKLIAEEVLSLFCAYPRTDFTQNANATIREICAQHSRVIPE